MASKMELACAALRAGTIDFGEFERRTRTDWRRLARHMHGRWVVPPSLSAEDVQQVMLLGAWSAVGAWDPDRGGMPLHRFVVWSALSRAAHEIHRERGALRRSGKAPSRCAMPAGDLLPEGRLGAHRAGQEAVAGLEFWRRRHSGAEVLLAELLLLAGGDAELAADQLLGDYRARLATGINSRRAARAALRDVADSLARFAA